MTIAQKLNHTIVYTLAQISFSDKIIDFDLTRMLLWYIFKNWFDFSKNNLLN